MKRIKQLLLVTCLGMFSLAVQAQTCGDKLRKARELQTSGLATSNLEKLNQAIYMYRQVSQCDPDVSDRCQKEINAINKVIKSLHPDLTVSTQEVRIPYQGGAKQIDVVSSGKWRVEGESLWCKADMLSGGSFAVQCMNANNSTREKRTTLSVKSGTVFKTLQVIQEARPEYIEVSAKSLSFPAAGSVEKIGIETNTNWDIMSYPSWCQIDKSTDSTLQIIVNPNDKSVDRQDKIVIVLPSNQTVTIKIAQGAGDEKLSLSHNDLSFAAEGDVQFVKVYTDADNWFVGDYPTWMNVQKIGNDSIRIQCTRNEPIGMERSGSVQVKTDRQTVGVMVSQSPLLVKDIVLPYSKVVSGRNLSFGINASYYMPFVGASAGGDYVGSVVDYGLGTNLENVSYKSATGFSVGLHADLRLYKNFFLTAGANFSQIKYKNTFNQPTVYTMPRSPYEYMRGELTNAYTEEYSHTMIEVPILASYRFKLNNISHLQVNLGPVINFGVSAKMKFSGNSDSETMRIYNSATNQPSNNSYYNRHTAVNTEFNLYQPCVYWEEMYTEGNDAAAPHHDEFQESPFNRVNVGLRAGVAYEWAGISFGLYYTQMLSNMANKNYWEQERWTVLNHSDVTMKGYKHRLNALELKLGYTFRYKYKKNK